MNRTIATLLLAGACAFAGGMAQASDGPVCGSGNGQPAAGAPIKVGGIIGNAAPGDFSSSADAAAAYFKCVNANGGVHGRPIEYMVENDQWNPELAAQAASASPRARAAAEASRSAVAAAATASVSAASAARRATSASRQRM